jgi:hypothetical protein
LRARLNTPWLVRSPWPPNKPVHGENRNRELQGKIARVAGIARIAGAESEAGARLRRRTRGGEFDSLIDPTVLFRICGDLVGSVTGHTRRVSLKLCGHP